MARCQSVRGVSNYQTGRELPDDQVIHLSPHSRVSGCNVGLECPYRMILIGVVSIVGRFLAENFFAGFF